MSLPKISIVTVSYNQGEFIRQNIESVLKQDYPNFEHIVVDGGSTDGTVEILKSYPHLLWTSQPDRGQSDALNKGFAKTSGEIIGWLNSDDWYAENIFKQVADALHNYPVVMGAAEQTDRQGKRTEVVPNTERSYYDLWRYWIPYAWLGQPSIFFRKSLLEEVKRPDGRYIDEDLFFTMDYDLWMRMAAKYPFTKRINSVLSHYRIYEENKTGRRPLATQRECSRVFRRYANRSAEHEQKISFIIPTDDISDPLKRTVSSIVEQVALDFDLLFVDYAKERATSKRIHEFVLDLGEGINHIGMRYTRSSTPNLYAAYNSGVEAAAAPIVAFLQAGDLVSKEFSLQVINIFSRDVVGLALPYNGKTDFEQLFYPSPDTINVAACFSMPFFFPNFIARRPALLELGTFRSWSCPVLAGRELILRILFRSWAFSCSKTLAITPIEKSYAQEDEVLSACSLQIIAKLLADMEKEFDNDPFTQVRAAIRDPRPFYKNLNQGLRPVIESAPADWITMGFAADLLSLQRTTNQFPSFAPGWYYLAKELQKHGQLDGANAAIVNYQSLQGAQGAPLRK